MVLDLSSCRVRSVSPYRYMRSLVEARDDAGRGSRPSPGGRGVRMKLEVNPEWKYGVIVGVTASGDRGTKVAKNQKQMENFPKHVMHQQWQRPQQRDRWTHPK